MGIEFMKKAREEFIKRGIAKEGDIYDVDITDEQFDEFEKKYDIVIPAECRAFLRVMGNNFFMIKAAVPQEDIFDNYLDTIHQIKKMSPDELDELDGDDSPYLEEIWTSFEAADKDEPLAKLAEALEGFRFFASQVKNPQISPDQVKHFLPIADWQTAGPLCIDTSKKLEDVDLDDPDTWQLRWFDHEYFDWEYENYVDEDGEVKGSIMLPDFESLVNLYFFGIYDKAYSMQLEEEEEDEPDKSTWVQ